MRHIASRLSWARVAGLAALAAASGAIALAAGTPVAAAATVSAPTLAVSYTNAEIGVTDSTGIVYTITNPNSSGTLYNVSYTDTLPSFATIDDPTGLTSSGCGTPNIGAGANNGVDGATTINVKAGTPCVIQFSIVGDVTGSGADTLGPLTYQTSATGVALTAPSSNETTGSLTVLAAPTATITAPKNGATYTYGQKVKVSYACTAPSDANGSTLSACTASDDEGNELAPGADIDTTDPGVRSIDVEAQDTDTDTADATVRYTVLPDNLDTLKSVTAAENGGVKLTLAVPGAGTVKVTETHGTTTFASRTVKVASLHKALSVPLTPTAAGRRLLTVEKQVNHTTVRVPVKVKVILAVTYTPTGGRAHTLARVLTLG